MNLTPYVCECCGGRINVARMQCEYCGTPYHDENLRHIKIRQVRPGEHVIRAEVILDLEHAAYNPEGARDYTLAQLRQQIADGLLGYMKITTCENFSPMYYNRTEIIRGEVRVIDPTFSDGY